MTLIGALRSLFPPGVAVAVARATPRAPRLYAGEAELIRDVKRTRRREFATGRWCARGAVRALGFPSTPILAEADGAPRWPEGLVGSISHSGGLCAAAVAMQELATGIGVDCQWERELSVDLARLFCTPHEIAWLRSGRGPIHHARTLALFCMKESARKCLRYGLGRLPGAEELEIRREPSAGRFRARLLGGSGGAVPELLPVECRCAYVGAVTIAGAIAMSPRDPTRLSPHQRVPSSTPDLWNSANSLKASRTA